MELSEKKSLLRLKEEEYKFLGEEMTVFHTQFIHWRKRLNLYKRRSKFGELIYKISKEIKNDDLHKHLFLKELKETNQRLMLKLDNNIKMSLATIKEKNGVNLLDLYEDLRENIKSLEDSKIRINIEISEKEKQLQALQLIRESPYRYYGKEMETLKNILMENSNEFMKEPKGPLGSLFTVKLMNWVPLVEHILEPYLSIFLVDNKMDADRLEEYISQIYGKYPVTSFPLNLDFLGLDINPIPKRPEVWITNFLEKPQDFSKSSVIGSKFPTLMEILDICKNDYIVKNTLGKFSKFEKILLFNNEHEAFGELSNANSVPENCILGYTKEFYKVNPFPSFGTTTMEKRITRGMIVKPSTTKTTTALKKEIEMLSKERDEKYDQLLKVERLKQLDVVMEIENINKKCNQLKFNLIHIQKTSNFIDSLYEEMFSKNPAHFATFIINGDIHEDCFKKAKEAAISIALNAKKRFKLERIIEKISIEISKLESISYKED